MSFRSTPFALLLALLMVLWQPLCFCDASEGEGGHSHGVQAQAAQATHLHGDASGATHDQAEGSHDEDGGGDPCDDHDSGCDCSKLVANLQSSSGVGSSDLGALNHAAVAWARVVFGESFVLAQAGLRAVRCEGLPPPPLPKRYRVLLI